MWHVRSMKGERKAVIVLITRRLNARVITGTRAGTTQVAATGEGFGIWRSDLVGSRH